MSFNDSFFKFGAMTPEVQVTDISNISNQEDQQFNSGIGSRSGSISRKMSKSSIGRSEDLSIPSPPLSPYQSSITSSTDQTNTIDSIISSNESNSYKPTIDTIVSLKTKTEYPIDSFVDLPLIINAWNNVGTKTFKKQQIQFLRNYMSRSKNYSSSSSNLKHYSRRYTPRRTIRSYYAESLSNTNNSDSEYNSQFEKVRTRRVARESSTNPQFKSRISTQIPSSSSSSLQSQLQTPKRRKQPNQSSPSPSTIINVDWESLPDFSPDTSLLPDNSRCLKVEWKGQPMNLSNDPLLDKLHPAEITLASILRLPCNLYLDSKRRLFAEKVTRLKRNLPFRRTDAQKSCRIDVNKASRLFAAFEKIGWLQDDKFKKFL